eukprot:c12604_g1_i1.p1 GENE.c12604_g1_i1~~c12604_g1_i1.p1  ORF type:complete len:1043 (-),score=248.02 c12604_g1_i1:131-3259(-)
MTRPKGKIEGAIFALLLLFCVVKSQECVEGRDKTTFRVSDAQLYGSAKSYHKILGSGPRSLSAFFPLDFQFSRPSLVEQLNSGVRVLDFDVVVKDNGDRVSTLYVINNAVDAKSECSNITECFSKINGWSVSNPGHGMLSIVVRFLGQTTSASACSTNELSSLRSCASSKCSNLPFISTAVDTACSTTSAEERLRCIRENPGLRLDAATCVAINCRSELNVVYGNCSNVAKCVTDVVTDDEHGCCDDSSDPDYCPDCLTCQYAKGATAAQSAMHSMQATLNGVTRQWSESDSLVSTTTFNNLFDNLAVDKYLPTKYYQSSYLTTPQNQLDYVSALQSAVWMAGWTSDRLLKVTDVQQTDSSIASALAAKGWPLLSEVRGRTAIIVGNTDFVESALKPYPFFRLSLPSDVSSPLRSIVSYSYSLAVPSSSAGNALMLTYADTFGDTTSNLRSNRSEALSSHSHMLMTWNPPTTAPFSTSSVATAPADWGTSTSFYIPGGSPGVCVSNLASYGCSPQQIENPNLITEGRCTWDDMVFRARLGSYAEQIYTTGTVVTTSSDLELTFDGFLELDVGNATTGIVKVQGAEQVVAVSFPNVNMVRSPIITSAIVYLQSKEQHTSNVNLTIAADITYSDPDALVAANFSYAVSDRLWSTTQMSWIPPAWGYAEEVSFMQQSPDISSVIQEVVSQPWWSGNTAQMVVLVKRDSVDLSVSADPATPQSPNGTRNAHAGVDEGSMPPSITIKYRPYSGLTVTVPIATFAEQLIVGGAVQVNSTDLELPRDTYWSTGEQVVGMRFESLNIPRGTKIDYAYVQFTTADTQQGDVALFVTLENSTHPDPFPIADLMTVYNYNLTDRYSTLNSCVWSPRSWRTELEQDVRQRTCNLASALQELVMSSTWDEQSATVVLIQRDSSDSGTSYRNSHSGRLGAAFRPFLTVQYRTEALESASVTKSTSLSPSVSPPPSPSVSVTLGSNGGGTGSSKSSSPDQMGVAIGVAIGAVALIAIIAIAIRRCRAARNPLVVPAGRTRTRVGIKKFDRVDDDNNL